MGVALTHVAPDVGPGEVDALEGEGVAGAAAVCGDHEREALRGVEEKARVVQLHDYLAPVQRGHLGMRRGDIVGPRYSLQHTLGLEIFTVEGFSI